MANRPAPLDTAVDKNGDRLSTVWQQWLQQLATFVAHITDYTEVNFQTPVNGFSIAMGATDKVLLMTPAGALAAGTVVLPTGPYDGQPVQVSSTKTITSLTLSPGSGETVFNAPTTLTAGVGFRYFYNAANTAWYRLS